VVASPPRHWPRWLQESSASVCYWCVFLWAYECLVCGTALGGRHARTRLFCYGLRHRCSFRGAAFCKYVCPIASSTSCNRFVSPLGSESREMKAFARHAGPKTASAAVMASLDVNCTCSSPQIRQHDCTFLSRLHSTLSSRHVRHSRAPPGSGPIARRTSLRRRSLQQASRPGGARLCLVFGAFANAAGMVCPVQAWRDRLDQLLGLSSPFLVTTHRLRCRAVTPATSAIGNGRLF